jgi:PPM family protein phosphatase
MSRNFEFANLSDTGKVRKANEDYYDSFESPNGYVFVLCDGMGGHIGGAVASQTAVEAIKMVFTERQFNSISDSLNEAIQYANTAIQNKVKQDPSLATMGTTAAVLVIQDNMVYYAHVGDSRIYFLRSNELSQLTRDHSYVQSLVDRGILTPEQAESHPKKNQITRALGTRDEVEPDICESPIKAADNDIFLLCSDGLTGMVSTEFVKQVLASTTSLNEKAIRLVAEANNNGGSDNITVQIVEFKMNK